MRAMFSTRSTLHAASARLGMFFRGGAAQISSALLIILFATGCSSTKQSWGDWMRTKHSKGFSAVAPAIPEKTGLTNNFTIAPRYRIGSGAHVKPGFDLKMRNPNFPQTHIAVVDVNLAAPTNGIRLGWAGPGANEAPTGPWRLTSGAGRPGLNCDDVIDSNTPESYCTPKGLFPVAGFADHLNSNVRCRYATWVVHEPRYVAIHSHSELPAKPSSAGCIRVPYEVAKLIHNNAIVGVTIIHIHGRWDPEGAHE
jgi:hypothetical protein